MKKIISGKELQNTMIESINLICNTVKKTLGPTGNNVLISNSEESVFLTNDGVTIANNISSDKEDINAILDIVKESSLKTNELVGDGTTTTLVLLQNIFNKGINLINNGKNRIMLRKELNNSLNKYLKALDKIKKKPTKKDLKSIAKTSSHDEIIGQIVSDVFSIMKNRYSIRLDESKTDKTYYEIKKGYNLELNNISNLYFQKENEIILNNCYVLVLKGYLNSLEQISEIINEGLINDKNIVIFVEDSLKNINEEIISYYLENKNIYIFNIPEYGNRREKIEIDLSKLTNAQIRNVDYESIYFSDAGIASKVIFNKDEIIIFSDQKNIDNLINTIEEENKNTYSQYEKDFIEERLSKLKNGIATIFVSGSTKTEIKEKIMHYEDALNSVEEAKKGVVLGEGVTFLKIANMIKKETCGDEIISESLTIPFKELVLNTGEDYDQILNKIITSNYSKVYNFTNQELESINKTDILDSVEVLKTALNNSVNIASILLTTDSLVINETITKDKEIL